MNTVLRELDDIPVTVVVAIAWATLAVVCGMQGDPKIFAERTLQYGLLAPSLVVHGEAWRLFGYAFLHANVLHLLINLASLWTLGPALERSLGSVRFALLYIAAAIGGGIAVCLVYEPGQPVVGGSGALFGMLGAAVAINMRAGRHLFAFLEFEGPRRLLGSIGANFVLGLLLPFISNTAHAGGLVAGFAITLLWLRPGAVTAGVWHWRAATTALFGSLLFWSLVPVGRW